LASSAMNQCRAIVLALVLAGGTVRDGVAEVPFPEQIDRIIDAAHRRDGLKSAEVSDDAEFVRRVYLDLAGVVPTASQARQFFEDEAKAKRERLVDRLVVAPEFSLQMARVFDAMLVERRVATIRSYDFKPADWQDWLATAFRRNIPWNRLSAVLLESDGTDPSEAAAARFYLVRAVEPHLVTRDIGRLFLGKDLQCAQCHDDPRIKAFRQADYYGLYAFVSRLKHFRDDKKKANFVTEKAAGDVSFTSAFSGEMGETNPRLPGGEMIADPPLIKGKEYSVKPEKGQMGVPAYSRRQLLSRQLPRKQTTGFSRNIANRLWAMMLGRGLVHPLDMHHPDNPPSHPELLERLGQRLEQTEYDIRGLLREIALTRTYQRSSRLPAGVDPKRPSRPSEFTVAALRPLTPEQLGWSMLQVTGRLPLRVERFERKLREASEQKTGKKAKTEPASQETSPGSSAGDGEVEERSWQAHRQAYRELGRELDSLVTVFSRLPGQPDNGFQPSADQALFLLNSEQMVKFTTDFQLLDQLTALTGKPGDLSNQLYLSVLSRLPDDEEQQEVRKLLQGDENREQRREAIRRIIWGLLLSAEFRLNH
jgi:hypothetical protein